jgi:hypothetical protein
LRNHGRNLSLRSFNCRKAKSGAAATRCFRSGLIAAAPDHAGHAGICRMRAEKQVACNSRKITFFEKLVYA